MIIRNTMIGSFKRPLRYNAFFVDTRHKFKAVILSNVPDSTAAMEYMLWAIRVAIFSLLVNARMLCFVKAKIHLICNSKWYLSTSNVNKRNHIYISWYSLKLEHFELSIYFLWKLIIAYLLQWYPSQWCQCCYKFRVLNLYPTRPLTGTENWQRRCRYSANSLNASAAL